jgi:hypothetical protein
MEFRQRCERGLQSMIQGTRVRRTRFDRFGHLFRQRNSAAFAKNIARFVSRNGCEPGRKFFRIAHSPTRFPCFDQGILHDILRLLAALQNAVSNGEKCPAVGANDHFKCLSIAVNGCPILFAFTGIHWFDLKPRRATPRFRANFFREIW